MRVVLVRLALLWLALGIGGCGGTTEGGGEAGDGQGCQIRGRVSFGGPVAGATVVLALREGEEFVERLSTESGQDGSFELMLPSGECWGAARIEALGAQASWLEAADGTPCGFDSQLRLRVDLPDLAQLRDRAVFLHPWTELAAALTDARAGRTETQDWVATLSLAQGLLAMHLDRKDPADLPFTDCFDPSAGSWPWPNPATRLGLLTAALSAEARLMGAWDAPDTCGADLLALLVADASDGIFDGRGLDCAGAGADCQQTRALEAVAGLPKVDSQLLRGTLARALHLFAAGERNASGVGPQVLGADDGLYEVISTGTGPLFPADEPGDAFDPLFPVLQLVDPSPDEGDCLNGPFSLVVEASDDHGLDLFDWQSTCPAEGTLEGGRLTLAVTPGLEGCEGPVSFTFTARDPAGNTSTLTRNVIPDTLLPTLAAPAWSPKCPLAWPEPLLLKEGADACPLVVLEGALGSCTRQDELTWLCPAPEDQALGNELTLQDRAGNGGALELNICPDKTSPLVTLLEPTAKWFGPLVAAAELEISDEWGVTSVELRLNGEVVVPEELQGLGSETVRARLAIPNDQGPLLLRVRAEDSNANYVLRDFDLVPDLEAPVLQVPEGAEPYPPVEAVLPFLATDATSEVLQVQVEAPEGWTAERQVEAGAWVARGEPPAGQSFEVKLRALDGAGNETRASAWMARDETAPELRLLPTVSLQETTMTVAKVGDLFVYTPTGDPVELSEKTCAVECPSLTKRTPLLAAVGVEDAEAKNLPLFRVWAGDGVDGGEALGLGRVVLLRASLLNGEKVLTSTQASPNEAEGVVELAVYWPLLFDEGASEPVVTPENQPETLVVEATDSCGNSSSRTYILNLNIVGPPLETTLEPKGPGNFTTVEELFDSDTPWELHGELAGAVLRVKNPTPFSAHIAFHSFYGRSSCLVKAARSYLSLHKDPRGSGCAVGSCRVVSGTDWTNTGLGKCQTPAQYAEETLHDAWSDVEAQLYDPIEGPLGVFGDQPRPLGPFQELLVVVKLDSSCLPQVAGLETLYIPGTPAQTVQAPVLQDGRSVALCLPGSGGTKAYAYDTSKKLTNLTIRSQEPMDQLGLACFPAGLGNLEVRFFKTPWEGQYEAAPGPALPPL